MLTRQRIEDGQTLRLTIKTVNEGWEIREERNDALVRVTRQKDWHRVERSIDLFERQGRPREVA
jgi:hypothetical protein